MNVAELIEILKKHPQDLQVTYRVFSEQQLLCPDDISQVVACAPRPDGWVQDRRPDKQTQTYLMFPGN